MAEHALPSGLKHASMAQSGGVIIAGSTPAGPLLMRRRRGAEWEMARRFYTRNEDGARRMTLPTHALICCIESDDIGVGNEMHVRLFPSEEEAEEYAVAKLVECGRYELMDGGGFVSCGVPPRVCTTRCEVLFDFDVNYLESMERFHVVPIQQI